MKGRSGSVCWLAACLLICQVDTSRQSMMCSYGPRGSLTSTCVNAVPSYFRTTSYRFDNLDETVRCVNCTLTVIDSNTFDISGNVIKTLDLTNSKIAVLKNKAFMGLMFLDSLLLTNNSITAIPPDTFVGINRLKNLDLENNAVAALVSGSFKQLTNLKSLNLKSNSIASIENGTFDGLEALNILDLSDNSVKTISGSFHGLTNIYSISLEKNRLARINSQDFDSPFYSLADFNLAHNELEAVPTGAFLNFPQLRFLNLSSNPIRSLAPSAFKGLRSLTVLDLVACNLDSVPKSTFRYLSELRHVNLARNRIVNFTPGLYTSLPELRVLNLSRNALVAFDPPGVFKLNNLHTLDFSFNNLSDLDFKLLVDYMPNLASIMLNGNHFPCYLGKEMEEFFQEDNLHYELGEEYEAETCNSTRPFVGTPEPESDSTDEPIHLSEAPSSQKNAAALVTASSSNGHEYVLYVFICVSLGLSVFLFYTQLKLRKEVRQSLGQTSISEVHLLSSQDA